MSTGRFREDRLYRVDVLRIALPPLCDRDDDVLLLAEHFWRQAQSVTGSRAAPARATLAALVRYHWPGNVRQLENVIASLVVRGPRRGVVGPSTLPACIAGETGRSRRYSRRVCCSSAGMLVVHWPGPAAGAGKQRWRWV